MKLNPPKGMRDTLIKETQMRSFVLDKILSSYRSAGFFEITTPAIEDKENISKSDGGDNLNLVFEILKRGESLKDALDNSKDLSDMALRYDLTLPLSRAYSANSESLPLPFKVIQTGLVYRAEKPQKGRLREFRQCDIDIIGDSSTDAEIELFTTSLGVLSALGFRGLELKINHRKLLYSILEKFGFYVQDIPSVCISLDKMDKIGLEGVESELVEKNFSKKSIDEVVKFIKNISSSDINTIDYVSKFMKDSSELKEVERVIDSTKKLIDGDYKIAFSPLLIRGQGYYTGIVAEVVSSQFSSSIAGGGRYDNMIGKFTGKNIPAVGFSIGFERIMSILLEKGYKCDGRKKMAIVYTQDDNFVSVLLKKKEFIESHDVSVFKEPKNKKKFFTDLSSLGFECVYFFSKGEMKYLDK